MGWCGGPGTQAGPSAINQTIHAFMNRLMPLINRFVFLILVGCAQTAAVLDESMIGGMGDCWDFIIGWLID